MTVSYSAEVATISTTTLFKLLFKWKGSVFRAVYKEFIVYAFVYMLLSLIYRFGLNSDQRETFEKVSIFMNTFTGYVPMAFILGFYVSIVFSRWASIFQRLPWPDTAVLTICTYLHGSDNLSKSYRETMVRYLLAALVVAWRDISAAVRKRFPTLQHIVDAGILRPDELEAYERASEVKSHKFYVPVQWVLNMLAKCRAESRIKADPLFRDCTARVLEYRGGIGEMTCNDWVSVPLIYTQIVAMATWFYFIVCLLGRQYLDPTKGYEGHDLDLYVPPFTFMQFWIYIGWLKAAEGMLNPLGENDDDFELNHIIERNFKVGISQANEHCGNFPILNAEPEIQSAADAEIPHTEASVGQHDSGPVLSAENITVPPALARQVSIAPSPGTPGTPCPDRSESLRRRFVRGNLFGGNRQLSRLSHFSNRLKSQISGKTSVQSSVGPQNGELGNVNAGLSESQSSLNSLSPSILNLLGLGPQQEQQQGEVSIHSENASGIIPSDATTEGASPRRSLRRLRSRDSGGSENEAVPNPKKLSSSSGQQVRIDVVDQPQWEPKRLQTVRENSGEEGENENETNETENTNQC